MRITLEIMKTIVRLSAIIILLNIFACVSNVDHESPDFHKTSFDEKQKWSVSVDSQIDMETKDSGSEPEPAEKIIQPEWWKLFGDTYFDQLISDAISGNFDLKIALNRVRRAELNIKSAKSRYYPSVNFSGSSSFYRRNNEEYENYSFSEPSTGLVIVNDDDDDNQTTAEYFNFGLNVNWELDLWGKTKNRVLSQRAAYEESKATYRAEYLRLVSEIAKAYFEILENDLWSHFLGKQVEDNQQKLLIYQNQFNEGLIDVWKVLRQEAELKNFEKEMIEMAHNRKILENRIATLLGKPAGEMSIPETNHLTQLKILDVPVGLPSELLSRRPDIIASHYRVLNSYHKLKESKLSRLPSISLTGNAGVAGNDLSNIIKQWTLGLLPSLSFPIFDGGNLSAQIAGDDVQAQISEDEYRKTVMKAFEEVENVLLNRQDHLKEKAVVEEKIEMVAKIYQQATVKLEMGLMSQLELFDIERELYSSQRTLLTLHRSLLDDTVNLFKVLGGGWHPEDYEPTHSIAQKKTPAQSDRPDRNIKLNGLNIQSDKSPTLKVTQLRIKESRHD